MKRRETGKKIMALALTIAMTLSLLPVTGLESSAKTELLMDDFDEIISTYNIDPSIPSYKEYMEEYGSQARPADVVEIPAADYARYEDNDAAAVPELYTDYEGMAGGSVLTSENSLIEFEVAVKTSGLYSAPQRPHRR